MGFGLRLTSMVIYELRLEAGNMAGSQEAKAVTATHGEGDTGSENTIKIEFNGIPIEIHNFEVRASIRFGNVQEARTKFGIKPVSVEDIMEKLKEQGNGNGRKAAESLDILNTVISDKLPEKDGNYWRVKEIKTEEKTAKLVFCDMLGTETVAGIEPFEIALDLPLATSFAVAQYKTGEEQTPLTLKEASRLIKESEDQYPQKLNNPPYQYFYADGDGKLQSGRPGSWIITTTRY